MQRVLVAVGRLGHHDEGQDLLEYCLLAVLIAVAGVIAVKAFGDTLNSVLWEYIAATF